MENLERLKKELNESLQHTELAISMHLSRKFLLLRKEIECDFKGISDSEMDMIKDALNDMRYLGKTYNIIAKDDGLLNWYKSKVSECEPMLKVGKNPYPKDMDMLTASAHIEAMKKLVKFLEGEVKHYMEMLFVFNNIYLASTGGREPKEGNYKVVTDGIFKQMTDNLTTYYKYLELAYEEDLSKTYSHARWFINTLQEYAKEMKLLKLDQNYLIGFSESLGNMDYNLGRYYLSGGVGEYKSSVDKCCADHSYYMINFVNKK